jgi:hypothetical protein
MAQVTDKNTASSSSLDEKLKKLMEKEDENFIENESFEDRWEKSIPIDEAFDHLLKHVRELWGK